jgi:hypothetical protein
MPVLELFKTLRPISDGTKDGKWHHHPCSRPKTSCNHPTMPCGKGAAFVVVWTNDYEAVLCTDCAIELLQLQERQWQKEA